jgi:hypothetical protein
MIAKIVLGCVATSFIVFLLLLLGKLLGIPPFVAVLLGLTVLPVLILLFLLVGSIIYQLMGWDNN